MSFSIDNIKASIEQSGVQKSSHFACAIIPPSGLSANFDYSLNRVNSINFPGFGLNTDEFRHMGYGLAEKRPISTGFEDISLTIIADAKGEIHNSIHDWFEMISPTNAEDIGADNIEYYEYPNEYYGGLELYIYDSTNNNHTTYTFINPYPIMLGSVQMSWENVDSLVLIPVTFTYRSYRKNSTSSGFDARVDRLFSTDTQNIIV